MPQKSEQIYIHHRFRLRKAGKMGNIGKNWLVYSILIGAFMLFGEFCFGSENTIYIINNNAPNYSSGYGGGAVCTEHGGICVSGRYMLSTSRVRYAPPQWKRPTIRERRLSEGKESVPYYYRQAYYR